MENTNQTNILETVIVEDNNFYNQLLTNQIHISNEGYAKDYNCVYNLSSYTTPESFKKELKKNIDLAFVDYYFDSELTGLDVLKHIKSKYPNCTVVIVSQSMNKKIALSSIENGADQYILKDTKALKKIRDILNDFVFERHKTLNNQIFS